jgi:hypothetical protein
MEKGSTGNYFQCQPVLPTIEPVTGATDFSGSRLPCASMIAAG